MYCYSMHSYIVLSVSTPHIPQFHGVGRNWEETGRLSVTKSAYKSPDELVRVNANHL